jgi:hypothetical protein
MNAGGSAVSASLRTLAMQRLMASSPTIRPPQHRSISASRETTVSPASARAISACITRGSTDSSRPPALIRRNDG